MKLDKQVIINQGRPNPICNDPGITGRYVFIGKVHDDKRLRTNTKQQG